MSEISLNISLGNCMHWGFWDAIKEFFQNGEDAEKVNPENKFNISYSPDLNTVVLTNTKGFLDRKSLLIGYSSKRDNDETIGKFGDGYKSGLSVLLRLGKRVTLKNYSKKEKWEIFSEPSSIFDNEIIIKVNIKKLIFKKPPHFDLAWEIEGVTQEEWDSIQTKYLPFIKNLDIIKTSYGSLIKNPELRGNIYVNNIFVETIEQTKYSYSFPPSILELDRDRKTVKSFNVSYYSTQIISAIDSKTPSEIDVVDIIKNKYLETSFFEHMHVSENTSNALVNSFELENCEKSYPVVGQTDLAYIRDFYPELKPVIVTSCFGSMLRKNETYSTPEKKMASINPYLADMEPTPYMELNNFLLRNKVLAYNDEFMDLLEKSKNWTVKK